MPVPAGYTLDQPSTPKLPAGYTLDAPSTPVRPAGLPAGVALPGLPDHPAVNMRGGEGNLETIPSSQSQPGVLGAVQTGIHNFGARVANNGLALLKPVLHPIQATNDVIQRGGFPLTPDAIKAASYNPSGPDAGATAANVLGDIATAGLLHIGGQAVPGVLQRVGGASQDSGATLLNKTAGMLKSDFKRGANGGRAYLDAGGGPAMSMQGLADKAATLKDSVGSQIGDMRNAASTSGVKIPTTDVASTLNSPISRGIALETGPGGLNNTAPIENYSSSLRPTLKAGVANGGLTLNELQDLKSGIADNTNWSDPSQFNLKSIRQQNVGGLSRLETDAIPEIGPLKTQFQGLGKFSSRAGDRASTGSMLLGGLEGHSALATIGGGLAGLALDSVPVKTTVANGLYRGGGLLNSAGGVLGRPTLFPTTAGIAPYYLNNKKNGSGNEETNK
jgi:hypothetical protein